MPSSTKRSSIPWITQYATPGLIRAIAYEDYPAGDDPNWRLSGAPTQEMYGRWCRHLCGMACLRMVLIARDGQAPTIFQLLEGCLRYGGYIEEPGGHIKGLFYQPFAAFVHSNFQLEAQVITALDSDRLLHELRAERLVIASVHKEIRRPELAPAGVGGHLVLVTDEGHGEVIFHNPSGHTPQSGISKMAIKTFDRFAAHRGVALSL